MPAVGQFVRLSRLSSSNQLGEAENQHFQVGVLIHDPHVLPVAGYKLIPEEVSLRRAIPSNHRLLILCQAKLGIDI